MVQHIEDADVRMIDRQIFSFLEGDAVQFVHGEEDAVLQHAVEFKVRLDGGLVDFETSLAKLLGIVLPVPRSQFMRSA